MLGVRSPRRSGRRRNCFHNFELDRACPLFGRRVWLVAEKVWLWPFWSKLMQTHEIACAKLPSFQQLPGDAMRAAISGVRPEEITEVATGFREEEYGVALDITVWRSTSRHGFNCFDAHQSCFFNRSSSARVSSRRF